VNLLSDYAHAVKMLYLTDVFNYNKKGLISYQTLRLLALLLSALSCVISFIFLGNFSLDASLFPNF